MFLEVVEKRNEELIDTSLTLHKQGLLEPDSYIIDMDCLRENAKKILEAGHKHHIDLYFMLKQIGRNPLIGRELIEMGYKGAVVVDYREAEIMMKHGIPLGNVGHLVQPPTHSLKSMIIYGVEVFTVFSFDKVKEINHAAKEVGCIQDVIVKVSRPEDLFYSGQMSGVDLEQLPEFIEKVSTLRNIRIVGATAFPCYLYNEEKGVVEPTPNYSTVAMAIKIMKHHGLTIKQINVPSTTCVSTLEVMASGIGTMGEPGHGLTGTTPAHAYHDLDEIPAVVYLSEISHTFRGKSYAFGGGHYRRSHVKNALIRDGIETAYDIVTPVKDDSIDYYFELDHEHSVGSGVIMAFRFQMFVTRSKVVLIEGIQTGNPHIMGTYDGLGKCYE